MATHQPLLLLLLLPRRVKAVACHRLRACMVSDGHGPWKVHPAPSSMTDGYMKRGHPKIAASMYANGSEH